MNGDSMNKIQQKASEEETTRTAEETKTYSAPELVEYGSLSALTNFGGSGSSDFFGMQIGMGM